MNPIFDWLFSQYDGVSAHIVVLELVGVLFSILSVLYSKKNSILVYPTGIVSTLIFVYILAVYGLLGDMLINSYYFAMSIYGWYIWTRKIDKNHYTPITRMRKKEHLYSVGIFLGTVIFVTLVYDFFNKWEAWYSYTDIFTTGLFFVGMWTMAKRKIENWIYLIIGDFISVPLYFYKGLIASAFLYLALAIIAIYGYNAWKNILNNTQQTA